MRDNNKKMKWDDYVAVFMRALALYSFFAFLVLFIVIYFTENVVLSEIFLLITPVVCMGGVGTIHYFIDRFSECKENVKK